MGLEEKLKRVLGGEAVVSGGVSLPVGFESVVDGVKKLNFGGNAGFNGSGLVVFCVLKTDEGVDVLGDVKVKDAVDGGKRDGLENAFVDGVEKGLLFAELVELVTVVLALKGIVEGWTMEDCGKKLNFGTASGFFVSSLFPGFLFVSDGSSSESPLMNNDSSLAMEGGEFSALGGSSTMPSDWACSAPTPLMTAGSVRPRRLCSTSLLENICFRREFESTKLVRIIKQIRTVGSDLLEIFPRPT